MRRAKETKEKRPEMGEVKLFPLSLTNASRVVSLELLVRKRTTSRARESSPKRATRQA